MLPPIALLAPPEPAFVELLVGSGRPLPPGHLCVFGATGDLVSKRAVRDALVYLAESGTLSHEKNPVLLLAQGQLPAAPYLEGFRTGDSDSKPITQAGFEAFRKLAGLEDRAAHLTGVSVTLLSDYQQLQKDLASHSAVFYGALPPKLYGVFLKNLQLSGLANPPQGGFRRVLLEKPFGNNSQEAEALAQQVESDFQPGQVFLLDHFLAYPGMVHMLQFRCDPAVDEALQARYVEKFEVKVLESIKSNDRPYFRETGLIKDMVQNHALQVFSTMALELPQEVDGEALSQAREQVIRAIEVEDDRVAFGQFDGFNDPAQGSPPKAAPSQAETFVSFGFQVHLPRWEGVQFCLINAKGVDQKRSGVDIRLRGLPPELARRWGAVADHPAILHTTMNPIDQITVTFPQENRELKIPPDTRVPERPPYATLFPQALRGEAAIFATPGESLAGWKLADHLTSLLSRKPLLHYPVGTRAESISN